MILVVGYFQSKAKAKLRKWGLSVLIFILRISPDARLPFDSQFRFRVEL